MLSIANLSVGEDLKMTIYIASEENIGTVGYFSAFLMQMQMANESTNSNRSQEQNINLNDDSVANIVKPTKRASKRATKRVTVENLGGDYFKNSYSYTESQLNNLNEIAKKIPESSVYGVFSDDVAYMNAITLLPSAGFEREHRNEVIRKDVVPLLKNCRNVLDVGVGDGDLSKFIDDYCNFVTVVDTKEESLNKLPENLGDCNNKIDKIKGSILEIKIPEKEYDFIVLSHILYYIGEKDRIALIDKLYSLLGENGKILVIFNDGAGREALAEHFDGKNHDFSKTKEHIFKYTDVHFYQSPETIRANDINTMMHIAGAILNDADTTATKEDLSSYLNEYCLREQMYEMDLIQNIILIGNARE